MIYLSKQALIDDLKKAALVYHGPTISETGEYPLAHEVRFSVEQTNRDGFPLVKVAHQGFFELEDGSCRFGLTSNRTRGDGVHPSVREFLLVKQVIADDGLTGTAAEVKAAIEAKVVRKRSAENISLRSLQVAVGLAKWAKIKSYLDAIVAGGGRNGAIVSEVLDALDPDKARLTVDPTTDEYRSQVDAIRSLVNAAAGSEIMTLADANVMKAIGEEPWTRQQGVFVREWQVANILSE